MAFKDVPRAQIKHQGENWPLTVYTFLFLSLSPIFRNLPSLNSSYLIPSYYLLAVSYLQCSMHTHTHTHTQLSLLPFSVSSPPNLISSMFTSVRRRKGAHFIDSSNEQAQISKTVKRRDFWKKRHLSNPIHYPQVPHQTPEEQGLASEHGSLFMKVFQPSSYKSHEKCMRHLDIQNFAMLNCVFWKQAHKKTCMRSQSLSQN